MLDQCNPLLFDNPTNYCLEICFVHIMLENASIVHASSIFHRQAEHLQELIGGFAKFSTTKSKTEDGCVPIELSSGRELANYTFEGLDLVAKEIPQVDALDEHLDGVIETEFLESGVIKPPRWGESVVVGDGV